MKVVISIVGTSLLSNKLNQYIRSGESLPPEFINCLDKEKWVNLSPRERKDLRSIVPAIRPDAEKELVTFLQLPSRFNPISASAETHSLKLLIDKLTDEESNLSKVLQQLKLYFIVSNTPAGRACACALMQFYRNIMKVKDVANLEVIENLTGDPKVFQQGITEMIDRLIKLITEERNKGNEVFLNATGGFKPESAYATVCGLLNQVKVCYVHEDFEGELCWLPSIPVGFDFTPWHLSASKVQLALSGEKAAYDLLPAEIKDLIKMDEKVKVFRFNQLGHVFWATYQDACAKHRLSLQRGLLTERIKDSRLRSKVLKFIDGWDNIWVGMQLPQMVDHTQAHCQNLLILAEQLLLPLENFLTEEELYVLIACLWLHDIGHSEPIEIKDDGTEVPLSPQEIRDKHHLLAYQLIKTWPREFGFPSFNEEAEVIATICKHHKTVNLNEVCERCELTIYDDKGISIISSKIRLRLITALLQFIDTCDIGVPRAGTEDYIRARLRVTEREAKNLEKRKELAESAGEKQFARFLEDNINFRKPARWHFGMHQKIGGVEIKPEKGDHSWKVRVIVHPRKDDIDVIDLISGDPMWMLEDLNRIKGFLQPYISDVVVEPGTAIW